MFIDKIYHNIRYHTIYELKLNIQIYYMPYLSEKKIELLIYSSQHFSNQPGFWSHLDTRSWKSHTLCLLLNPLLRRSFCLCILNNAGIPDSGTNRSDWFFCSSCFLLSESDFVPALQWLRLWMSPEDVPVSSLPNESAKAAGSCSIYIYRKSDRFPVSYSIPAGFPLFLSLRTTRSQRFLSIRLFRIIWKKLLLRVEMVEHPFNLISLRARSRHT